MTTSRTAPIVSCDVCGGGPSAYASFRAVVVILIGFHVRTRSGGFCRDCGLAVFREQQKFTLVAGWWGIPAPAGLIALLMNASQLARINRLPPPRYDAGPPPGIGNRFGRPLRPGRPVGQSPALIVPILLAVAFLIVCCGPRFLYD
ncbi:hypothetical protein QLQ12_09475 [Actinoplanes sp. NEAU-A12]|uniref:Uncharacterized protein n=1 Tax=Actinoplanes sandaracinus TaxID=3045177 RepID=A0ABT6WGH3_9ACTN|nr:hypothetical protein [Actinoplanes sandaracinus]MDI6098828.1 hypothetical protein [Actinoplanes sandaracinus]